MTMTRQPTRRFLLKGLLVWTCAIFCWPLLAEPPRFTIGKLSDDPAKQLKELNQMSDTLASALQAFGYTEGYEQVFRDFDDAAAALASAEVDLFTTTLYEAAHLMSRGVAEPLLLKWKKELPRYSSLIIVRANSGIEDLAGLVGHTIGFEDPGSTSAYFIPRQAFERAGIPLLPVGQGESSSAVHYRFTDSEQNSSALLFRGSVDAIALSDYDWLKADHVPESQRDEFRIIYVSDPIPRGIELVRATMPEAERQALRDFMQNMHLRVEMVEALDDYHETSRFSSLSEEDLNLLQQAIETIETP